MILRSVFHSTPHRLLNPLFSSRARSTLVTATSRLSSITTQVAKQVFQSPLGKSVLVIPQSSKPVFQKLSTLPTVATNLSKGIPLLFPWFFAYLLYCYKEKHLQNINLRLPASSHCRTVTMRLGKADHEHRFDFELKEGRLFRFLSSTQSDSHSSPLFKRRVNLIKELLTPFTLFIWKRHEFETVYNIVIEGSAACSVKGPCVTSCALPDQDKDQLRIVQCQEKDFKGGVPVSSKENVRYKSLQSKYKTVRSIWIDLKGKEGAEEWCQRVIIPPQNREDDTQRYLDCKIVTVSSGLE